MKKTLCSQVCFFLAAFLLNASGKEVENVPVEWKCVGPGGGGWIQSILASRHDPNRLFVGCDVGGFYRSEDGGKTYATHNTGLQNLYLECLAEHPANPQILFAASRGGIYKSIDGGMHWKELRDGLPPVSDYSFTVQISKILFAPDSPDTVYAAVGQPRERKGGLGEIYRTDDGGDNWRQIVPQGALAGDLNIFDFSIHSRKPDRFLISTQRGVFLSTDGGQTWKASNKGLPAHLRTRHLAQCPAKPDVVYVSLQAKGGETPWHAGVYRSDDGGATWRPCNNGLKQVSGKPGMDDMFCSWVDCLAVHPANPDIVYAGGASWWDCGVYKTEDGGKRWRQVFAPVSRGWISFWGPAVTCLTISPCVPDTLAFGTSGLVFRSEDGGATWRQHYTQERTDGKICGSGLEVTCLHSVTPHPNMKGRFYLGYFDIGLLITEDNGLTFRRCMEGIPLKFANSCFTVAPSPTDPMRLWAGFGSWGPNEGTVAESRDGGATWKPLDAPVNGWMHARPRYMSAVNGASNEYTLCCLADGLGVQVSEDSGRTWQARTNGLPVRETVCLTRNGASLYAGTRAAERAFGAVYRSGDLGKTWTRVTTDALKIGNVCQIAAKDGFVVATARESYTKELGRMEGGAWSSEDGGMTWRQIYKAKFCDAVAIGANRHVFLGMNDHPYHDHAVAGGIVESPDGGETWRCLNSDSLANRNIHALAVDPFDPAYLWAGTGGNSVFIGRVPRE